MERPSPTAPSAGPAVPPAGPSASQAGGGNPVPCPLCEYDLRGLAEPRCPECGYRFTWDELSDPARRFHPWLFEHHPERNAWSFAQTLIGGVFATTFWSTLYPTQPSRPRRIVAYWVLCGLPLAAAAGVLAWLNVAGVLNAMRAQPWNKYRPEQVVQWTVDFDIRGGSTVLLSLMFLTWPWLTLAALLVFQISMRRARLRWTHVLRCVLYAGDVVFWCAAPVLLILLFTWAGRVWPPQSPLGELWPLVALGLGLWLTYRLFHAYEFYLRFDHAMATVLASQVMVALVYWKAWYFVQGF